MKNVRVARRYAGALMEAAEQHRTIEQTASDLEIVAAALRGSRDLRLLTQNPVVSPAKKAGVFRAVFASRIGARTMEFLDLVIAKQRGEHLLEIADEFSLLRDRKMGIVSVDVTSAVEFTPSQRADLAGELERYTGKKVRMRLTVDAAIRAGIVVRIGDTVLDASMRRQLELLKARFLEGGASTN
ncbi:MAG TPA: ATP synthase F1 subunit delta [Bacteroidota bacterium]|nr:ATP synthase F1 subunit delta [Bacteroidota bacterium]